MLVQIDEKLFLHSKDKSREQLISYCDLLNDRIRIESVDFPSRKRTSRPEFTAIAGLGIAAVAVVISYLQLQQARNTTLTRKELIEEVDAYLKLKGIYEYSFIFESGFDNIIENNGRPCRIGVSIRNQTPANIYLGVTKDKIWISSIECDWRAFT